MLNSILYIVGHFITLILPENYAIVGFVKERFAKSYFQTQYNDKILPVKESTCPVW